MGPMARGHEHEGPRRGKSGWAEWGLKVESEADVARTRRAIRDHNNASIRGSPNAVRSPTRPTDARSVP